MFDLSREQQAAVDRCLALMQARRGGFVFITGAAGTGKSTILREIKKFAKLLVCSPTGIAAVNVGGTTIHSLFRFGIGLKTYSQVKANYDRAPLFAAAGAIVIDEISMCSAPMIDMIDAFLRKTLENDSPFGGKLIIAFGDLWQLEPVIKSGSVEEEFVRSRYKSKFWFDAAALNSGQQTIDGELAKVETIELLEVFRQQGDAGFLDALNAIRVGDPSGLKFFNACVRHESTDDVSITFTNAKADQINAEHLSALPYESITYTGELGGEMKESDLPAPLEIELKVGSKVMFVKNIHGNTGYIANGTIGKVFGFYEGFPLVAVNGGIEIVRHEIWQKLAYSINKESDSIDELPDGEYRQIPLKLAWAITAHKSQGQTLDAATLQLERPAQTHGQLYVALSRVKTVDGLSLRRKLTARDINVNPRVQEFMTDLKVVDLEAFAA